MDDPTFPPAANRLEARPTWVDAPGQTTFRSYGNCDAKPTNEGKQIRMAVVSHRRFVLAFGILFIPIFVTVCWFAIPDLATRLFFCIFGAFAGVVVHALLYGLFWYHESLGDYLIVDLAQQTLELPRAKVSFPLDQVFAFQIVTGEGKSSDRDTDLNLLVAGDDTLVRYHVMGSPSRKMVEEVAAHAGLRVIEADLDHDGFNDSDRSTS